MATKTEPNGAAATALIDLDLNEHASGAATFLPPYRMEFLIEGVAPILFHRYDCDAVAMKGAAAKGSADKKSDNIESYLYRDHEKRLCIPAVGVHSALITSARWMQDPRSPRKSAMDLVKASLVVEPTLIPCLRGGKPVTEPEFLDKRRVQVQRAAVARVRPAMDTGWQASLLITVLQPEYLAPPQIRELMSRVGQLVGLCDFRPQFGRFQIVSARLVET